MVEYNDFTFFLDSLPSRNYLVKHWVNNLNKPVLIRVLFMQAEEEEAQFPFSLHACEKMLPLLLQYHTFIMQGKN